MRPLNIQFPEYFDTAVIASGQTVSTPIDLTKYTLMGMFMPSNYTGTTFTIQAATSTSGPWFNVQVAGADYTLTTAANKYTPIENLAVTAGLRYIQITAGSTQSTSSTIILSIRPVQ